MPSVIAAGTTSGTSLNLSADTSGVLQLATNGTTTAVTIDTSQNVGIGTASPAATLDVTHSNGGRVRIRGVSSDGARMEFFNNAATTNGFLIGQGFGTGSDNIAYLSNQATADMIFRTAATERMRITSAGNVGIGTSSPNSKLDVAGTVAGGGSVVITLTDTTNNLTSQLIRTGASYSYAGVGALETWLYSQGTNNLSLGPDGAGAVKIVTNGSERMRIDSSGRVTTPFQPAFLAGTTQNDFTVNSNAIFPFDVASINVGGNYNTSTYKFTAPVAGLYQVMWMCFYTDSGGATNMMNTAPFKNDAQILIADDAIMGCAKPSDTGGQICVGGTAIVSLAANDTLSLYARGSNVRIYGGHSFFSGYLIG